MKNVEYVKPSGIFTNYIYKAIPLAFDQSMSYYETLAGILKLLKSSVIPAVNNNAELLQQLEDYVTHYFDNLDVQQEINNKLDEMAESGELTEIIAQYLELAGVLAYDKASDLAGATNINEGSICMILGRNTYNDGKTNFYKIRALINTDVIDGDNLIGLTNYPTLVAEKIHNYYINSLQNQIDHLLDKKWVFIGDSYGQGYNPDGNVTGWPLIIKNYLGLSNSQYIINCQGGAGFANVSNLYADMINGMSVDNSVTDVLIAGGYNDLSYSSSAIATGFGNVKTAIETKFPNAKVHVAYIPCCANSNRGNLYLMYTYYLKNTNAYGWDFLGNVSYSLLNIGFLASDNIHLTQNGENAVSKAMYQALNGGYNYSTFNELTLTKNTDIFNSGTSPLRLMSFNDISVLSNYYGIIYMSVKNNDSRIDLSSTQQINIGSITRNGLIGRGYYGNQYDSIGDVVVHDAILGWFTLSGKISIDLDGNLMLKLHTPTNDTHNNYLILTAVDTIQLPIFSINTPTMTL